VARSSSNAEIAKQLCIIERTAAKYVSSILRKLGLKSRTQAALLALNEGIVKIVYWYRGG